MDRDYFDFELKEELAEEYSEEKINCPHCQRPISVDVLFCLYCGESVSPGKKNNWVVLVALLVLFAFILWVLIL